MICSSCQTSKDATRLPSGWKRQDDTILCGDCWHTRYVVRSVAFSVAEAIGVSWQEFCQALNQSWGLSTSLANWSMCELIKHDVVRTLAMEKLPPLPPDRKGGIYLYGLAGAAHGGYPQWAEWDGMKSSAQCIFRAVRKKYAAVRKNIIWLHDASASRFRYPYPFPVHNDCWGIERRDRQPVLTVTLGGTAFDLRLRSGREFRRQLAAFDFLAAHPDMRCELRLRRQGSKKHIMVDLVGWLPRPAVAERQHTLLVRTDPCAFWVVELEGHSPWIVNADHVQRWCGEHRAYLQRISEDTKAEMRWPRRVRHNLNKSRELRCEKWRNRLTTWIHMVTAQLVQYAQRRHVGEVIYDDSCQGYLGSFPWHELRTKLSYKLDAVGIVLTAAGTTSGDEECTQNATCNA